MEYLHLFNSESEFTQQYYSQDYNEPWVSLTPVPIKFRMTWADDEYYYEEV